MILIPNLKTKLATIALLAITLIALSIPVMATVCQYGAVGAAKECTATDNTGDVCAPDVVQAVDEAPACEEGSDNVPAPCEAVDVPAVDDGCGAVTINPGAAPCENIAVYSEKPICDESEHSTVTAPCTEVKTKKTTCETNKVCNGSKTYTCPKDTKPCTATPHMPPTVPEWVD
jgi:hypothetical protein